MSSALVRAIAIIAVAVALLGSDPAAAGDAATSPKDQARSASKSPDAEQEQGQSHEPCPKCVPILATLIGPMPKVTLPSLRLLAPLGRLWHAGCEEEPNRYHHSQFHPVPTRPVFEPRVPAVPEIVSVAQLPPRPIPMPLEPIAAPPEPSAAKRIPLPEVMPTWPEPSPSSRKTEPLLAPLPTTSGEQVR